MLKEMPKVGDKVRFMGGEEDDILTIGNVYEVSHIEAEYGGYVATIDGITPDNAQWYIQDGNHGEGCDFHKYELVAEESDAVNSPAHYKRGKFETIEIIEEITQGYDDGFVAHCAGTAIKYIARAPFKHATPLEDLRKASKYLEFAIARIEGSGE